MALINLGIRHFRNLQPVDIEPAADLNIIIGENASGKTSVLEAIYFLGRATSFRTNRFDRILQKGQNSLAVYARLKSQKGQIVPFGVQKDAKTVKIRVNEQKVTKVSDLVANLPLQVIHPNSHQLLEEGPKFRRRFLDWGVFHVEQTFYPAWQRYQKALKQRNMALRKKSRKDYISIWDKELIDNALILDKLRKNYINDLQEILHHYIKPVLGDMDSCVEYQQGWQKDMDFPEALEKAIEKDMDRGYTTVGPQRADVKILVDGVLANERISRGQQKILVTGLLLAQAGLFNQKTNKKCILLIDDVAAELDEKNREALLSILINMDVQMFLTSIEKQTLSSVLDSAKSGKMFHVEHGVLSEVI
ncbi:MAG: DNA replication/repair protein RecF [Gammaproteobacteria bacterium]|nr:DNA replication/repair protein RecF [Gammaproteobacteria bacterium]